MAVNVKLCLTFSNSHLKEEESQITTIKHRENITNSISFEVFVILDTWGEFIC